MRVVEFFCGIGGCAAACPDTWQVVAAIDVNRQAIEVYRHNFSHGTIVSGVEHLTTDLVRSFRGDLWWFSPPCQPFTVRGNRQDLSDPRAAVFTAMLRQVQACLPEYVALGNVGGFQGSQAQSLWVGSLRSWGYSVHERLLCPTELSVPARRPRWYVMASRRRIVAPELGDAPPHRPLIDFLDSGDFQREWEVPMEIQQRYAKALDVVDPLQPKAMMRCFTSAYGKSPVRSGSYVATPFGVRYVMPEEILRLMGFPMRYQLPNGLTRRQAWALVGNSLSVTAVRQVLTWLTRV